MINIIFSINGLYGYGQYAHGTINKQGSIKNTLLNETNDYEYAIRPKYNDRCWQSLLKYRIREDEI